MITGNKLILMVLMIDRNFKMEISKDQNGGDKFWQFICSGKYRRLRTKMTFKILS